MSLRKGIAAVAVSCVALGLVVTQPAGAAEADTVDRTAAQAVAYGAELGVTSAIAVFDERTGRVYTAGDAESFFGSASVMKLFVATKLLATGQLQDPTIEATAYSMITRSDDDALNQLLPLVDGTNVVNWVKDYYGIPFLGEPSHKDGCWGNTQISAKGIAFFYHHMTHDPAVGPWLVDAMHHYQNLGADGTDQTFGLPQAARGHIGVKQGWGHCSSNTDGSIINSTGLIGHDRFDVAILTNTNNWSTNDNSYNATQAYVATQMAKILMPHGYIRVPRSYDPSSANTTAPTPPSTPRVQPSSGPSTGK
jgi:hypothetical protein